MQLSQDSLQCSSDPQCTFTDRRSDPQCTVFGPQCRQCSSAALQCSVLELELASKKSGREELVAENWGLVG